MFLFKFLFGGLQLIDDLSINLKCSCLNSSLADCNRKDKEFIVDELKEFKFLFGGLQLLLQKFNLPSLLGLNSSLADCNAKKYAEEISEELSSLNSSLADCNSPSPQRDSSPK